MLGDGDQTGGRRSLRTRGFPVDDGFRRGLRAGPRHPRAECDAHELREELATPDWNAEPAGSPGAASTPRCADCASMAARISRSMASRFGLPALWRDLLRHAHRLAPRTRRARLLRDLLFHEFQGRKPRRRPGAHARPRYLGPRAGCEGRRRRLPSARRPGQFVGGDGLPGYFEDSLLRDLDFSGELYAGFKLVASRRVGIERLRTNCF